jgi:hypothetical protein
MTPRAVVHVYCVIELAQLADAASAFTAPIRSVVPANRTIRADFNKLDFENFRRDI